MWIFPANSALFEPVRGARAALLHVARLCLTLAKRIWGRRSKKPKTPPMDSWTQIALFGAVFFVDED